MKRFSLLFTFLLLTFIKLYATIHHISVADFQFSPTAVPNVIIGDTVQWNWVSGFHTTTSTSVPGGATPWDSPITSGSSSFQYIATVAGQYAYVCTPHAPGMAGTFIVSAPVPVLLSEFLALNNGSQTTLNWKTSSEQNSDYFSVKRSINGSDYTEIGRVEAAGSSEAAKSYSFTDPSIPDNSKFVYYLIMIVDKDGKTQHSPTRMIVNKLAKAKLITSLSPNPISRQGHLMVKFSADEAGEMEAILSDMQGKAIRKIILSAVRGVNNGHIHLGDLPRGTYNLSFSLNRAKELHRIIVQ